MTHQIKASIVGGYTRSNIKYDGGLTNGGDFPSPCSCMTDFTNTEKTTDVLISCDCKCLSS